VLLLHGFGDTPQTLTALARHLHSSGYAVSVPRYPGHGTTVEDFFASRAEEWIGEARRAFVELRASADSISIVGLSMGAALAAALAEEFTDVRCIVLLAPYLKVPLWIRTAVALRWLWSPFLRTVNAQHPDSVQDPVARGKGLAYGVVNARVMRELERAVDIGWDALPGVKTPALVIQSRNDPRVSAATAAAVEQRLGSREKSLVWTETGGHVITVDYGHELVFFETEKWIRRWSEQPRHE
jgi:carboxylesterase